MMMIRCANSKKKTLDAMLCLRGLLFKNRSLRVESNNSNQKGERKKQQKKDKNKQTTRKGANQRLATSLVFYMQFLPKEFPPPPQPQPQSLSFPFLCHRTNFKKRPCGGPASSNNDREWLKMLLSKSSVSPFPFPLPPNAALSLPTRLFPSSPVRSHIRPASSVGIMYIVANTSAVNE
ncbi:hypothetical protein BDP81DRAFT_61631 [Colletotrichum phormii]|uniref:Uncharacterized protein n=1 Tax=Colletotrichum phormii TaxID=359342 RepID=A0AAI9ZMV2_9PEZI|nr:uncharacterized protein BDP81DRAFT_61631 [Colletotrichum phormii]KAK1633828.1 hypothetical protein BDP81DRAFT_61631 [Colletotrichum phormii]